MPTKRRQLERDVMRIMAWRGMSIDELEARHVVEIVVDGLREPTDMMVKAGSMEVPAFQGTGAACNNARAQFNAMLDQIDK